MINTMHSNQLYNIICTVKETKYEIYKNKNLHWTKILFRSSVS